MANVEQCIPGCSTGQIQGLNRQVLEKVIELKGSILTRVDHELINISGSQNNPYLQTNAYINLVRAVEERGRTLRINSALRTVMQQYMLRRQYQRGLCGIRAAAPPGGSNHNHALAIDIQDSAAWRSTLEKHGWKWIGAFDPMHYSAKGENLTYIQVKAFQELWNEYNPNNKLKPDGGWGPRTAKCVASAPAQGFGMPPVLRRNDFSEDVGELQLALRKALNIAPHQLAADQHFGPATEEAVTKFQQANNLTPDGIAGASTIKKLEELTGLKL